MSCFLRIGQKCINYPRIQFQRPPPISPYPVSSYPETNLIFLYHISSYPETTPILPYPVSSNQNPPILISTLVTSHGLLYLHRSPCTSHEPYFLSIIIPVSCNEDHCEAIQIPHESPVDVMQPFCGFCVLFRLLENVDFFQEVMDEIEDIFQDHCKGKIHQEQMLHDLAVRSSRCRKKVQTTSVENNIDCIQ